MTPTSSFSAIVGYIAPRARSASSVTTRVRTVPPRRGGADQQGDRRGTRYQRPHGRQLLAPHLRQARLLLPRCGCGALRAGASLTERDSKKRNLLGTDAWHRFFLLRCFSERAGKFSVT